MENIDFRKDLLVGLFKEYCDRYDELNAKFSAVPVAKYEYCNGVKGGVWRGYYNPSPISDIVVDNANRGRRVMHPRKGCYYRYRYSFDANGKLFVVEDYSEEFGKPKPVIYFDERRKLCVARDTSEQAIVSEPVLWQKEFLIYEGRRVIAPQYDIVFTPELGTISVCDYDGGRIVSYDFFRKDGSLVTYEIPKSKRRKV